MSKRVLRITHTKSDRKDRASALLRERGYELETIRPIDGERLPEARTAGYDAVVVYGGPQSINDAEELTYIAEEIAWTRDWVEAGGRFLGLCLGGQMLAKAFGAEIRRHPEGLHEIGYVEVMPLNEPCSFLPTPMHVYHWHNEGFEVPPGGERLAAGPVFPNQAFRLSRRAYGLQFHPEVTPEIFESWFEEVGDISDRPGAHAPDRQRRDAERHHAPLGDWFGRFLDDWLED